jgi:hypothetical protein
MASFERIAERNEALSITWARLCGKGFQRPFLHHQSVDGTVTLLFRFADTALNFESNLLLSDAIFI